jgi:hypothetical protein
MAPIVRITRPTTILQLAAVALTCALTASAALAAIPIPTNCQNDVDGANDQPGQKDITRFCFDLGDSSPYELLALTNWDETKLTGANTADICTLFNTDGDAFANLAVCVQLKSSGGGGGNLAIFGELRLFTCNDTRADRCAGATLVPGPYTTTCEVTQQPTDPFSPAAPNGPGDDFPDDTQMVCGIDLDDFGPAGVGAVLIDACSYPSAIPGSDPSDCIAFKTCTLDSQCDDGNVCTTDACDPSGACVHTPNPGGACTDGLFCNGDEVCNSLGFCAPDTPRDCDDGVSCTIDSCDELTDSCINDPRNSICNDGVYCNGVEICDPLNDCQVGTPVDCSDGVSCTIDGCDEGTASCTHSPSNAACNDGLHCNGVETCDPLNDCQPGTPPNCNDGVGCTVDTCNETTDSCDHTPNNASCSNGLFCDGMEVCHPTNDCQPGTPPNCNDGVGCTVDTCNETTDSCDNTPNNGACSDGNFCTGVEICHPQNDCQPGSDPCPGIFCNETTDQCVGCLIDAHCNNGVFCDGAETCNVGTGTCAPGTPPSCNDGVACTVDSCDETNDTCSNVPANAVCDDGAYCNGSETCHPTLGCQAGTPVVCSDGVSCTVDTCDEATDSCTSAPSDALCDDGLYCNGVETCSPSVGCVNGTPVACADTVTCSIDSCDEATDSCVYDFGGCLCGDGEITGSEQCDPPATAGTFEDCNNNVDDDGDGLVDCRDPDCAPGARLPVCDEGCTEDLVCTKFEKDPGIIRYDRNGGHDFLSLHGRFPLLPGKEALAEGFTFELANEYGAIYRAFLDLGQLKGNASGTRYRFVDKTAKLLGQESPSGAGGLFKVGLILRTYNNQPYVSFRVRAYGDFSFATRIVMTTQLATGTAVGSLTAPWIPNKRGWKLPLTNF